MQKPIKVPTKKMLSALDFTQARRGSWFDVILQSARGCYLEEHMEEVYRQIQTLKIKDTISLATTIKISSGSIGDMQTTMIDIETDIHTNLDDK